MADLGVRVRLLGSSALGPQKYITRSLGFQTTDALKRNWELKITTERKEGGNFSAALLWGDCGGALSVCTSRWHKGTQRCLSN